MTTGQQHADGSLSFSVKVVPRASRDEIMGTEGDVLKVRLKAPPVEGRANEALIAFLADRLGVGKAQVEILHGSRSRKKLVKVRGISPTVLAERLGVK